MKELTKHEKATLKNIFEELKKRELFVGKYKEKNGNRDYVCGIGTVMECLAYMIDEKYAGDFYHEFFENMLTSEEKADII